MTIRFLQASRIFDLLVFRVSPRLNYPGESLFGLVSYWEFGSRDYFSTKIGMKVVKM